MRTIGCLMLAVVLCAGSVARAQPKKLVLITQSKGFDHEVVKQKEGKPSVVEATFNALADKTGMFVVEHSRDASILTPDKLKETDIVVFYTTGVLPMKPDDLDAWIAAGGKFLGIHPATDTFHDTPVYQKLIGGQFQSHPWNQNTKITMKILDADHSAAKPWVDAGEAALTFNEEIYQHKHFDPDNVHVILGLDMEKTELKKPYFVPIAWCREQGKGKVFYTSLGHRPEVWANPVYQEHLVAALKWLNGDAPGSATPNADLSQREDEIAKKVAPPEKPKAEKPKDAEKKAEADVPPAPALPKIPDGFTATVFAYAPDIKSPASIAASPDGRLFVGEDEYNTQPKRDPGLSRVKLCVDTDNDGSADKFTVFADKINSPQGMTYVGGTLYVAHAPLLTAFRDTNNDGVADERHDLITGLGPVPEGLVHHVPSGLRMGIDGWLYISIGDKGIEKAVGKDGRTVSLWGGGVVRVRPDGTMIELYSTRTRNTFDVSVGPLMDLFTRDNTNDGNGWDSRLSQMQRDGEYGYPTLFKNFPDEIIEPIASYGSGSATGSMYVHEPGFPGTTGDSLFTCDWARGILYRHDLKRKGAGFEATQEEFIKDIRPADVDVDGRGGFYLSDWGRRDWGNAAPVGHVFLLRPIVPPPTTAPTNTSATQPAFVRIPFPDMTRASDDELLGFLASPSQTWRVNAMCELVRRGPSSARSAALVAMAMKKGELYPRVAAICTLKQLDGEDANGKLATIAALPELREFALRELASRDDQLYGVSAAMFVQSLKDPNPRVRLQAATGLGHLKQPVVATQLLPSLNDTDPLVRHAAMQSLRLLKAEDACIAALSDPTLAPGALRVLREFHTDKTVTAVTRFYATAPTPALRQEAIKALTKLYHVESKWDGKWWTPHPDTRGPYYVHEPWKGTDRVSAAMVNAIGDADLQSARLVLTYLGLVEMKEAVPSLQRIIAGGGPLKDDAARALIAVKSSSTDSIAMLERVVLGDGFNPEVRSAAAQALASMEFAKALPILVRLLSKLDTQPKLPQGLIEKVADALSGKPTPADKVNTVMPLLVASKPVTRTAAATTLLRSTEPAVQEQITRVWASGDAMRVEALLSAVPKVPSERSQPFAKSIHALLKDKRDNLRQSATIALGHIGDESAVKDLVQLASRDRDPLPAVSALAGIDPAKTADDQVLLIATLLVENSAKVQKSNQDAYAKLVSAAQKFISDPRVPAMKATSLRSKLMEPGVIYQYMQADPIPVPPGGSNFSAMFAPDQNAKGPFGPFSVKGKAITWKPIVVTDPQGKQVITAPDNSIIYLSATYESSLAGAGFLTASSDDGLQVYVNGTRVHSKNIDRGLKPDSDKLTVNLNHGPNVLLFRVSNNAGVAGIQARLRTKMAEFDLDEAQRMPKYVRGEVARGRKVFEAVGCVRCHTTDRHDDPKGPFLGDVGAKFDTKYLVESILNPSSKIAQGFATEMVTTSDKAEYIGFITRETADEIDLRDLTGKVTVLRKETIAKRRPLPGSMMPQGLLDNIGLDDFSSLIAYLESMKK